VDILTYGTLQANSNTDIFTDKKTIKTQDMVHHCYVDNSG